MLFRAIGRSVLTLIAVLSFGASDSQALSMKECSAKYKAAQAAGTLNGKTWNQFRKDECGSGAAATSTTEKTTRPKADAPAPPAAGNAVFPTGVATKYSSESAGKARMHTCLDQYRANKTSNGNGGLKWIQKGGGYYSECNKRLKG